MAYEKEMELAKQVAHEAGQIIRKNFSLASKREWKADNTPVTATDVTVNKLVIERIAAEYPDHSVLGEEESVQNESEYTWVCDPVDGTMPFSHGVQISTFSLALTKNGKPYLGVIYDPFMDRLFYATIGSGAFMNGDPIHVSGNEDLHNALINAEGFPGSTVVINSRHSIQPLLVEAGAKATNYWSVILPTALVAAGQFTGVIFNVTKPEDGAAAKVIVEEAGGKMTDMFGDEQRYDRPTKGYIASNGKTHQQLLDIVNKYSQLA